KSRVELIRQVLHHLPPNTTSFSEVQKRYQYYIDDIQKGANNFADEVLKDSSNEENETPQWRSTFDVNSIVFRIKEEPALDYGSALADNQKISGTIADQLGNCVSKLLKNANDMKSNVRAPVRGGSLPNRKAQYAKIPREPIPQENIEVSSKVNSIDLIERKYVGRPVKQVIESSPKCENPRESGPTFVTARQQLLMDGQKQQGGQSASPYAKSEVVKKSLGSRGPRMAFVPPFARSKDENQQPHPTGGGPATTATQPICPSSSGNTVVDERLKQFDQKIIDLITSEVNTKTFVYTDRT
ncbi:unnamed protein product, partial [Hymenolepis diminuta]